MAKKHFTKNGFGGLSTRGKLIDVAVFVGTLVIAWFLLRASANNPLGAGAAVALSFAVAWIVQFFLPRDTYYYTEHFCADCGQFLGYGPSVCERCGCNRYTTEDTGVGKTFRGN